MNDIQEMIMRSLSGAQGQLIGMPAYTDKSEDQVMGAIEDLQRRQSVRVVGPPNMNSLIGQDVDELHLLPSGAAFLRTLRG